MQQKYLNEIIALLAYWQECGIDWLVGDLADEVDVAIEPIENIALDNRQEIVIKAVSTIHPISVNPQQDLTDLAAEVTLCRQCRLAEMRTQTVFGTGSHSPMVAFVGEGPGAEEDRQGLPFVGTAGQLLTRMLFAIGLTREEVYIANVVKCRPPGNRNPLPDEIALCQNYLFRQLELIRPKFIVALGRFAILSLLGQDQTIGAIRGKKPYVWRNIPVIPTYHPAFYLRQPSRKKDAWEDLLFLKEQIDHFLDFSPFVDSCLSESTGMVGSAEPIAGGTVPPTAGG